MINKIRKFFENNLLLSNRELRLVGEYGYFDNGIMFHSGRTDNQDGHNQYDTSTYHYHHGYPAHTHDNNKCPYLPITLWHNENYSTFHSKLTTDISIDLYDKEGNFLKNYLGKKVYTGSGLGSRSELIAVDKNTIENIYNELSLSKYKLQYVDDYYSLHSFIDGDCNFIYNSSNNKVILKQYYVTLSQFRKIGWTSSNTNSKMVEEFNNMLTKYNVLDINNIQHLLAQASYETGYYGPGSSLVEVGSEAYFNSKPYKYKYRGTGYIQLTYAYGYQAFATYKILECYPSLKSEFEYKNPKNKGAEEIRTNYNSLVGFAINNQLETYEFRNVVTIGSEWVAKNYAWESALYFWTVNDINSIANKQGDQIVDEVTKIVNLYTDTYQKRKDIYTNQILKYII